MADHFGHDNNDDGDGMTRQRRVHGEVLTRLVNDWDQRLTEQWHQQRERCAAGLDKQRHHADLAERPDGE